MGPSTVRLSHMVRCKHCEKRFDLVRARWCTCGVCPDRPSKVCPHCLQCICLHPDYHNEALWGDPPPFLRRLGFIKLFYLYL